MAKEGELDLEPATPTTQVNSGHVLVPMHADNWSLALASGYLGGGALKADHAADFQSHAGADVWGFAGAVPDWALVEGEDGPRVVLRFASEGFVERQDSSAQSRPGPVRVTRVEEACFESREALDNFMASYTLFPDVPTDVVPAAAAGYPRVPVGRPETLGPPASPIVAERRRELDFYAGWAAALLELLEAGEFHQEVVRSLEQGATTPSELAEHSLRAFEPAASALDVAVWKATIEGIRRRYGTRGFDREEFLDEIGDAVVSLGGDAAAWVNGCRQVFSGERDVPNLDDTAHVGRRAALALMLAHEPAALSQLEDALGAGPRVRALVVQAAYAFGGFSRLDAIHKRPSARLDAVLSVAEALAGGRPVSVSTQSLATNADLSRREAIVVDGTAAFSRTVEAAAHLLMLKARAQEAGFNVRVDEELGRLCILGRRPKGPVIFVEHNDCSTPDQPVVNLVLDLAKVGVRPTTTGLKSYLELAWKHSVAVGLRSSGGVETVCAFASISLATLDRDEFRFYVERLLAISEVVEGNKKPRRTAKKPAGA
ncbi:hypothetical protein GCM10022276_12980 [Sphingomonas limnosediminicola]|uniref:Uncharacterized protein n=1 Tax=Sphingomonas limnosediminicola TaxID=940133 RepID=A0ABP7L9C0_9SPHN